MFTRSAYVSTLVTTTVLALSATAHAIAPTEQPFSPQQPPIFKPTGTIWCEVPHLLGLNFYSDTGQEELLRRVGDANCQIGGDLVLDFESEEPYGTIIDQSLFPGTRTRKEGSQISLTVSVNSGF